MIAAELFRSVFGRAPEGVWRAPGRVNLIGEHTDYHGGLALPFAIDRHIDVAVARRDDDRVRCVSMQSSLRADIDLDTLADGALPGWTAYPLGVARMLGVATTGRGFDLAVSSTLPSGSGLSSSAALEIATALALRDLHGLDLGDLELARACQRTENLVVGAPTGLMDQLAILLARADHALLLDFADVSATPVPLPLAAHGVAAVVVDTAVPHSTAGGEYAERRRRGERAAAVLGVATLSEIDVHGLDDVAAKLAGDTEALRAARHVIAENDRVRRTCAALSDGDLTQVGRLLDASHQSLRDDLGVSCAELDLAVACAREAGALGARLVGAGFGGSILALVPVDIVDAVVEDVVAPLRRRGFAATGMTVAAVDGARRVV